MTAVRPESRLAAGEPVTFLCEGSRLYGSLHRPSKRLPGAPGVILLNQGPVDRAGSHRLYIKLTERLTAMGLVVLRFDARGVGESEGAWPQEDVRITVPDIYGHIQRGAWTPDALAAIEFMRREAGVDRVVLGGLCGGAVTAVFAGADHAAVDAVFGIGMPVTFAHVTQLAAVPDAVLKREASGYFRKLLRPSAWTRFLTFQTDYRTIVRLFSAQLRRRLSRLRTADGRAEENEENDQAVNVPLLKTIDRAARARKPLLFVFSGNDDLWHEFEERLPRFGADRSRLPFDLVTIPNANHILTEDRWQQELYDQVATWLTSHIGGARRRTA